MRSSTLPTVVDASTLPTDVAHSPGPTGSIAIATVGYLASGNGVCVGGSLPTSADAIAAAQWVIITELALSAPDRLSGRTT